MKTITLPSGMKCRPRRLRGAYRGVREFLAYCETYSIARRLTGDPDADPRELWEANPYVVSSVVPSDLAIYNPSIHPTA